MIRIHLHPSTHPHASENSEHTANSASKTLANRLNSKQLQHYLYRHFLFQPGSLWEPSRTTRCRPGGRAAAALNINRALRLSVRPLRAAYTTRGAAADPHLRSPGRDFTSPPGRRRRSRPPAAPRSVPTSAPRPDLSPEPTPAHRSLAPAQPLSHPRLSPRGPSAHRRLLRQLLSRPLPAATPGAAPPSRQLLLLLPPFPAPPSRSPSPARRRRACAQRRRPGRSPGAVSRIFPSRRREGGREGAIGGAGRALDPARLRCARAGRRSRPGGA